MSDIIQINPHILKINGDFIKIVSIYAARPEDTTIGILLTNGTVYNYTIKNKHETEWILKKLSEIIPKSTLIPYYTKRGIYSTYLITPQFISAFTLNKTPDISKSKNNEVIPPVWTIDIITSLPASTLDGDDLISFPINLFTSPPTNMESTLEAMYTSFETMILDFMTQ